MAVAATTAPPTGSATAQPNAKSIEALKAASKDIVIKSIPGWFLEPVWVWIME